MENVIISQILFRKETNLQNATFNNQAANIELEEEKKTSDYNMYSSRSTWVSGSRARIFMIFRVVSPVHLNDDGNWKYLKLFSIKFDTNNDRGLVTALLLKDTWPRIRPDKIWIILSYVQAIWIVLSYVQG